MTLTAIQLDRAVGAVLASTAGEALGSQSPGRRAVRRRWLDPRPHRSTL